MPKIKVDVSEAFCQKKGCKERGEHRHHRGHEFLFTHRWMGSKDPNKKKFVKRYWEFRKSDVVLLCPRHHAEVHLDLDVEILEYLKGQKKSLELFNYEDAMKLVRRLRKYSDAWLQRETPGVDPKLVFGRVFSTKKRRRIATRRYHDEKNKDA